MKTIGLVVTGHGEEEAVPVLVRRILHAAEIFAIQAGSRAAGSLIRKPESSVLKKDSDVLERAVGRVRSRADAVLVVLDLEDGCPATEAPLLLERVRRVCPDKPHAVVIAYREFETWFLFDVQSLLGTPPPQAPEQFRDAKGWLRRNGLPGYNERADSPGLCGRLDLQLVRGASDSFRVLGDRVLGIAAALGVAP